MGILNIFNLRQSQNRTEILPSAGHLFVYHAGTEILAPIYRDENLTHLRANPMEFSKQNAFPLCYVENGTYRIEICDARGTKLEEISEASVISPFVPRAPHQFVTVAELLGDGILTYDVQDGRYTVSPNDLIQVTRGQYGYLVLAADSASPDLQTAGGIKLKALPIGGDESRTFSPEQFGAVPSAALYEDLANRRWCVDEALTQPATDYTTALQRCFDVANVIEGGSGHYMVTELEVGSNTNILRTRRSRSRM